MATSTPHLLLRKPAPADLANVTTDVSDNMAKIDAGLLAIAKPPRCRVTRATAQNIVHATVVPVQWTAEDYDTANLWDVAAPTKLFAPVAGTYRVQSGVQMQIYAPGGIRVFQAYRYSAAGVALTSLFSGQSNPNSIWFAEQTHAGECYFDAGDYAEVSVYQNSGVTIILDAVTYTTWASMRLVAVA
jgi:hypothetical protein